MHLTSKALSLYRNSNPNLNLYSSLTFENLLVNFYFDTIASRVDGESWTDVGKTRQGGEVADERGDENEIKAKRLFHKLYFWSMFQEM